MNDHALTTVESAMPLAFTPEGVKAHVNTIARLMQDVLQKGEHFGPMPGTKAKEGEKEKMVLMKSGAEKLGLMFGLVPTFAIQLDTFDHGHREYRVTCRLATRAGALVAEGVGSCSTLESKYRYRKASRVCPTCGKDTIIKTKGGRNPGGYWCVPDKGGCGANFNAGAPEIEDQEVGRIDNADIADVYNTVLKMAKKRAHVDAMITACAASDIFTQDLDEELELELQRKSEVRKPAAAAEPPAKEAAPAAPKAPAASTSASATPAPASSKSSASPSAARPAPAAGTTDAKFTTATATPSSTATADAVKAFGQRLTNLAGRTLATAVWKAWANDQTDLARQLQRIVGAIEDGTRDMGDRFWDVISEAQGDLRLPPNPADKAAVWPPKAMVEVFINAVCAAAEPVVVHDAQPADQEGT